MTFTITAEQKKKIESLEKSTGTNDSVKRKARVVLNLAAEKHPTVAACLVGEKDSEGNFTMSDNPMNIQTVNKIRKIFPELGVEAILGNSSKGRPRKNIEGLSEFIQSTLLSTPDVDENENSPKQWSAKLLAQKANDSGKFSDTISSEMIRRIQLRTKEEIQEKRVQNLFNRAKKKAKQNGYSLGEFQKHTTLENLWTSTCEETGEVCGVVYPTSTSQPWDMIGKPVSEKREEK